MDAQELSRLLELAAKAVGYGVYRRLLWRPHEDDGDSRRLEVALRLGIDHNYPADENLWVSACPQGMFLCAIEYFEDESQRAAAARLAVLRAAAAVGESMNAAP